MHPIVQMVLAVACLTVFAVQAEARAPCNTEQVAGKAYVICRIDLDKADITVRWRGHDGKPLGSLRAVERDVARRGGRLLVAMNAGMYHEDLDPVGYHVEHRDRLAEANTRRGPGNFHMLPNGIFFVEKGRAGVMETRAFLKRARRPDFATQSGPMLVIDGRLHRLFNPESQSRNTRNGVGVSPDGRIAFFVLSEAPVTFHAFAMVFLDHLKLRNALYLDGNVSQLVSSNISRRGLRPVGPVIVVTER